MIAKAVFIFLLVLLTHVKAQKREGDSCVDKYTNTVGRCMPAAACDSARNDFQVNGIVPTFCTYSAFGTTLVCCRDGISILHTAGNKNPKPIWDNEPNREADTRRVSERSDNDLTSPLPPTEETYYGYQYDSPETEGTKLTTKRENKSDKKGEKNDSLLYEKEIELVSKLWGMKLRKLDSEQRRYAEKMINDVLFYAEINQLTSDYLYVFKPVRGSESNVTSSP